MKRDLNDIRSVIEANTERRSLEQLAAQGKKHVRVISGERVMELIRAVVDDVIAREVGALSQKDRDRIVAETKVQFDRVSKIQAESEGVVREQKEMLADYKRRVEETEAREKELAGKVEAERRALASREEAHQRLAAELERARAALKDEQIRHAAEVMGLRQEAQQAQANQSASSSELVREAREAQKSLAGELAEARRASQEAQERQTRELAEVRESGKGDVERAREESREAADRAQTLERNAAKLEERLETARSTIQNYDAEISRLTAQLKEDARVLGEMRDAFVAKEGEVRRYEGLVQALQQELASAREGAGETKMVQAMRGEMAEMKAFLATLDQRTAGADQATVEELVRKLTERESVSTKDMETRFSAAMDKTLDQISRTLHAATARPLDEVVEATEVVVAKLFDHGAEMETNLESLEVDERRSKSGIAGNLERLRAMRQNKAPAEPPKGGGEGKD